MKTSTLGTPTSTTDLMTYDGEYKTDFDKFRDMSGLAQGAIIASGVVAVAAAGYAIYKGIEFMKDNKQSNSNYSMYPNQQQYYQYQTPLQQSAVNIQGQYTTNDNQQPTVSFQANSTPVQPQYVQQPIQPQMQQPQQFQRTERIILPNGQVQDVPVNTQPTSPIYQQPVQQVQ